VRGNGLGQDVEIAEDAERRGDVVVPVKIDHRVVHALLVRSLKRELELKNRESTIHHQGYHRTDLMFSAT
jgi:hypothetical protein